MYILGCGFYAEFENLRKAFMKVLRALAGRLSTKEREGEYYCGVECRAKITPSNQPVVLCLFKGFRVEMCRTDYTKPRGLPCYTDGLLCCSCAFQFSLK